MPRILVVDDEAMIALMIGDWLMELGCEAVGPAHSVRSALELLASTTVNAAILDLSLGGEDSYAVADALQAKAIPFAFATGYGARDISAKYANAPLLSKPFNFAAMKDTVKALLAMASRP